MSTDRQASPLGALGGPMVGGFALARKVLAGLAAVGAAAAPAGACETLRGQAVSFIVTSAPGGGFDAYARLLEPYLERELDAELVVRNVAGAGGIIGSKAIRDARPDGRTIGIVNGTRLVIRSVIEGADVPSPLTDLAVLGELDAAGSVWVVAPSSPLRSVEDLWSGGRAAPLVFGAADLSGEVLAETWIPAGLLGLEIRLVSGYGGTGQSLLALLRGEIDLYSLTVESALLATRSGEARPVLQLGDRPLAGDPALAAVPLLAGPQGVAVRRAAELGQPVEEATALADAVVALTVTRRLVVAPRGLPADLMGCLDRAVTAAATEPGFVSDARASGRSLDVLPGAAARARLEALAAAAARLRPLLEAARRGSAR